MAGTLATHFLLGVDIGTYNSKGLLLSSDGEVRAESACEHGITLVRPNWIEQDPDQCYWEDFKRIVRDLIRKTGVNQKDIRGVAVSGTAPDIVPIDKSGVPVRTAIIYMDRRAQNECEELSECCRNCRASKQHENNHFGDHSADIRSFVGTGSIVFGSTIETMNEHGEAHRLRQATSTEIESAIRFGKDKCCARVPGAGNHQQEESQDTHETERRKVRNKKNRFPIEFKRRVDRCRPGGGA